MMYCYQNKYIFTSILLFLFLEIQNICFVQPGLQVVDDYTLYLNKQQKLAESCISKWNVFSQNIPGDVKAAGHGIRLVSDAATYFF